MGLVAIALDVFPKHSYEAVKMVMTTVQNQSSKKINKQNKNRIKNKWGSDTRLPAYPKAGTGGTMFVCLIDSMMFPPGCGGQKLAQIEESFCLVVHKLKLQSIFPNGERLCVLSGQRKAGRSAVRPQSFPLCAATVFF